MGTMGKDKEMEEKIRLIISIIAGILGSILSSLVGFPTPLGVLVLAVYLFYDTFKRDPSKLSEEELRDHLRRAIELEEMYRRELEDLERVKRRVESGEIPISDTSALNMRIEQLKELMKRARAKKNIVETILMARESRKMSEEQFGINFDKLVSDVVRLKEKIDEALKRGGVGEIDLEGVSEYLKNVMLLIIEESRKYAEKTGLKEEVVPPRPVESPRDELEKLLVDGTVEQWVELIRKALNGNFKIRLPPGRYHEEKGYKNLLKSLYALDFDTGTLKKVISDRVLMRFAEYLRALKEGKALEVDVLSSDLSYISDMLEKISDEIEERTEDGTKIRVYRFTANSERVAIERRAVVDQITRRATKVVFKRVT